jgi:predicted nucleic acid-binding protein
MQRIYLDSNVFISLINKEFGFSLRSLFVEAENFFLRVAENKDVLVLSNHCINEINDSAHYSKNDIVEHLSYFGFVVEVVCEPKEIKFSKYAKLCSHFKDSLHLALAMHFECDCIVTFNAKDFENAKKVISVLLPGDY